MRKMNLDAQKEANGGHYRIIVCRSCSSAYQDSFLGALACNAHMKRTGHGSAYSYRYRDVCGTMGKKCSQNGKYF